MVEVSLLKHVLHELLASTGLTLLNHSTTNLHRKVVKEQLKSLGVSDQIKSLVAETKGQPAKGKPTSITQQQAIDELKVKIWHATTALLCLASYLRRQGCRLTPTMWSPRGGA